MKWYVYNSEPVDLGWENLKSTSQTLAIMVQDNDGRDLDKEKIDDFLRAWESAKAAARDAGWEGDFTVNPSVFWLPIGMEFQYAFAIKQSNNGNTFIVSPVELPWLNE